MVLLRKRTPASPSACVALTSSYSGQATLRRDGSLIKTCFRSLSSSQVTDRTRVESDDSISTACWRHRVNFSHVTIREYSRECGDNPSVSSGPPLTLGWDYNEKGKLDIECYEADKTCSERECKRLSAEEREHLLINIGGHSHRRVLTAQYEAQLAHQQRSKTIDDLGGLGNTKYIGPRERILIMKESAARKLERAYKGTSPAKEQRKLWENARRVSLVREEEVKDKALTKRHSM